MYLGHRPSLGRWDQELGEVGGGVPGLAALRGARVGRGVFVAGRLHARRFALERFTRRGQRLVYGGQDVSRLGLRAAEKKGLLARRWFRRSAARALDRFHGLPFRA